VVRRYQVPLKYSVLILRSFARFAENEKTPRRDSDVRGEPEEEEEEEEEEKDVQTDGGGRGTIVTAVNYSH